MKNESQIKIKIVEIIQQNLNLPEDREISDSTPLADIISNSVEFIQIIVDIEDEFAVEFKNDELGFQYFPYIGDFGRSDVEFCRALLLEEQVAIIPGSAFGPGGAGYARVCYAAERAKIEEALRRMARFLKRLRTEKE